MQTTMQLHPCTRSALNRPIIAPITRGCKHSTLKYSQRRSAATGKQQAATASLAHLPLRQPTRCSSSSGVTEPAPVVVVEGDIVTFHMTCRDPDGKILESTKDTTKENEPMCFEIGAGDIISNPLFQAFDGALRGLGIGEAIEIQISGGDWKQDLLFVVPRDHPEIERLEGRYKNHGGLHEGLAVELANSSMAVVVEATPEYVKLDANNMMAGKTLLFELEVLSIERSS